MDKKRALVIAALLIIAAGAWALSSRLNGLKVDPTVAEQFQWEIVDRGVSATSSAPQADVILRVAGIEVPLGTYDGTCSLIDGTHVTLMPDEVSGVVCLWQDKGQEIGIFTDGVKLSLKQGSISSGGSGVTSRTHFIELKRL